MTKPRKSWREKIHGAKGLPKIAVLDAAKQKKFGAKTLLIPAATEVDALMKKVPKGKISTIGALRSSLARDHRAEAACPITTGIFAWIAAQAAAEAAEAGEKKTAPWWRTLKNGGELNPKYPGGISVQRRLLSAEGHRFAPRGQRVVVADCDAVLFLP